jgi:hypothetical protein
VNSVSTASFDALFIAKSLRATAEGLTQDEIFVFAYLGCLIAFYDNRQPSWWEYSFTATEAGYPASEALREACSFLVAGGSFAKRAESLELTNVGERDIESLELFGSYKTRIRYLTAACGTALTLPLPSVSESLSADPQLRSALLSNQVRPLLDRTGMALLRPYVDGLQEALELADVGRQREDLLVPAVVWLSYLAHEKSLHQ